MHVHSCCSEFAIAFAGLPSLPVSILSFLLSLHIETIFLIAAPKYAFKGYLKMCMFSFVLHCLLRNT